jgi:SSS family solute:Na+ symporter
MTLSLVVLIAYMVITTLIGMVYANRNKTSKEYFVAERSLSIPFIVALLFSEIIAGAGTIGNAAEAFKGGYSSVWANWGMFLGCLLFVFLTAKFFRAMGSVKGVMSVPEAYGCIFDQRSRIVILINVVVVYFILYSTQPVAAAAIISPMLNLDQTFLTWLISALFILITLTGGMKGISKMNMVHAFVMYFGMAMVSVMALRHVGGMDFLQKTLPQSYFTFTQPNVLSVFAQAVGTAVGFLASANVAGATFSANSLTTARSGILVAAVLIFPFALMPATVGMCAKAVMPDINPNAALFLMSIELGSIFGGLAATAIIAAIWSTGPALLLIICTTLTKDLFSAFIRPDATDREQIIFSKVMAIVIGIIATYFGMNAKSILGQMLGAFQIRSVVGIVLVLALYCTWINKDGAFYSMLVGGIVACIWHFAHNPFDVEPLWPAVTVTIVILVIFGLLNKEKESAGYRMYREAIKKLDEKYL